MITGPEFFLSMRDRMFLKQNIDPAIFRFKTKGTIETPDLIFAHSLGGTKDGLTIKRSEYLVSLDRILCGNGHRESIRVFNHALQLGQFRPFWIHKPRKDDRKIFRDPIGGRPIESINLCILQKLCFREFFSDRDLKISISFIDRIS